ncbi:MAG: hypothetical protein AB1445_09105 [Bacillota bacterium]
MLGTWLVLILIVVWQVPLVVQRRQWPELRLFAFLWLIGAVYASLVAANANIPNPTEIIIQIVEFFLPP